MIRATSVVLAILVLAALFVTLVTGALRPAPLSADEAAPGYGMQPTGGFRLEVAEQEKMPADAAFERDYETKMIDFGPETDPMKAKVWEIWVRCAVALNPDAKTPAEMGWVALPEELVGWLRPAAPSAGASKTGTVTGFQIAFHRPAMTKEALQAALKRGENVRVTSVDVRQIPQVTDGKIPGGKASIDPNPVVISKVGTAYLAGDGDVFLCARPIHPDSKESQEASRAEGSAKAKGPRPYRALLRLRRMIEMKPDGTFSAPGGDPPAEEAPGGTVPPSSR